MRAYGPALSIRKLLLALVAMAVLFAPAFTTAGAVFAAVPQHNMPMMEAGHCQFSPAADHDAAHDEAPAKSCCIAMCMALAIAPAAPMRAIAPPREVAAFPNPPAYVGLPGEIATPPPRRA